MLGDLTDWHKRYRRLRRPAFMGTIRRTRPLSDNWGYDRGWPIDRYYIQSFLERHRADIHGRVLEVKDTLYTSRLGVDVDEKDVLDVDPANEEATFVADLAHAESVPSVTFDCFVLTQTLQFVSEPVEAIRHAHRILKPGGVLLVTVPVVSKLESSFPDLWRFTPALCERLFADRFGAENVEIWSPGNVLVTIAFLAGMAVDELRPRELADHDPRFPLIVAVRAVKAHSSVAQSTAGPARND
jgi:SAM-dependent methyltransferase